MKFVYRAIKQGEIAKGEIDAKTKEKAIEILKANRITILDVAPKKNPIFNSDALVNHISFNEIVNLTRHLSIMLNAGLTITDSIEIIKKQSESKGLAKLINGIEEEIRAGNSLSAALENHPDHFSNFYIALVKAGEASGKLDNVLDKLAHNLEKQREFKGKITGALIYPVIILIVMFVVIFLMITFVIPNLLNVYKSFDAELPPQTLFLINLSDFFVAWWWLILLSIGAAGWGILKYKQSRTGKKTMDRIMLHVPVVGKVLKVSALVDTTRTLSILVSSGVSLLDALDIITETTNNIVYQEALGNLRKGVEKGSPLWAIMEEQVVFPQILIQMTRVGEQTGKLDETLDHLSRYFEAESEMAVKALTTMIEPTVLVLLGITVGFVVFSIITPIFSLTSSI